MGLTNDSKEAEYYGADKLLASKKKRSNRRNRFETKATNDAIPSEDDKNSFAEKDVSEDSGEETRVRHQGSDYTAKIRQRRHYSDAKALSQVYDRKKPSSPDRRALAQTEVGSLFSEIANDIWKWLKYSFKIWRACYPVWKWLVVGYLVWMGLSYLLASVYRTVSSKLSPVCSSWIIRSTVPFCNWLPDAGSQVTDISKVATSQEGLTVVMDRVGENFDLARDMTGHEFAIRDLKIRVSASNLSRGQEIARELESLSRNTRKTAKDLSRFTAKVGKSIDAVHAFDQYAIKSLEKITERERNPPTLPGQVLSVLSPLAAFAPSTADQSEEEVKRVFIYTADKISNKVKILIDDSFELGHNLDKIQETLDRIKELALDELGDLPRANILEALWNHLTRPDDYEQQKAHTALLVDITEFYKRSSFVMEETVAALNRIEAELGEFRDDYATPGLILKEHPLEVIVELLRKSGQRLETGRQKLEFIEEGARPQKN